MTQMQNRELGRGLARLRCAVGITSARPNGVSIAVGIAYFVAARFGLALLTAPMVWPSSGPLPVFPPAP